MYKGTLFIPLDKSTWKVLCPFKVHLSYTPKDDLKQVGVNIYEIPAGSRFKIKYKKRYGGGADAVLHFTTTLNIHGPIRGGFEIDNLNISIEAEQLS